LSLWSAKTAGISGHNPTTQAESSTSTWYAFAGHVNNRRTPLMIGGKLGCRPLAAPLCRACKLLRRPPILSYDGYAPYNWKRFRKDQPIALGNIDTIQNFVHLYDEHWFILVHVDIEALAGRILDAIAKVEIALSLGERNIVDDALWAIARAVSDQAKVLRRIPEKMDPALYYKTFRPYIRFFENVFYEAMEQRPIADSDGHAPAMVRVNFRGETGAPCPR
jgi:indoleamine 2,3-dioxygenase